MPEYTADHLEQHVLDPLFYRYEKAIRAQVRLERELATVKQECARLSAVEAKLSYQTSREEDLRKHVANLRAGETQIRALYEAAEHLQFVADLHPNRDPRSRKNEIGKAAMDLRAAMADAAKYIDLIPF